MVHMREGGTDAGKAAAGGCGGERQLQAALVGRPMVTPSRH